MITKQNIQKFGVFIPKGFPVVDTESCACIAYYDESNGCSFKSEKGKHYFRPKNRFPIAVSREMCEYAIAKVKSSNTEDPASRLQAANKHLARLS